MTKEVDMTKEFFRSHEWALSHLCKHGHANFPWVKYAKHLLRTSQWSHQTEQLYATYNAPKPTAKQALVATLFGFQQPPINISSSLMACFVCFGATTNDLQAVLAFADRKRTNNLWPSTILTSLSMMDVAATKDLAYPWLLWAAHHTDLESVNYRHPIFDNVVKAHPTLTESQAHRLHQAQCNRVNVFLAHHYDIALPHRKSIHESPWGLAMEPMEQMDVVYFYTSRLVAEKHLKPGTFDENVWHVFATLVPKHMQFAVRNGFVPKNEQALVVGTFGLQSTPDDVRRKRLRALLQVIPMPPETRKTLQGLISRVPQFRYWSSWTCVDELLDAAKDEKDALRLHL